ncbi:hypothetical protein CC1G_11641 [Coprinopsis cinerea okayama7|uniref:NADAR domain-containing protein n=1 Tax=Coprinopsis cinerea (strain Okayama-7 / 130 / ATCC MYA-4618 / FGSC 9003) TaxID=240176 RepID=A8P484_COPC7|nr:hypothetical protein CC1G_11641 [Coprinopsis cinerea okayama7\|eukprot:XP_001838698.2 hypothetical protein CC1G_11641 [Coprinopsis cinerea okayama7\
MASSHRKTITILTSPTTSTNSLPGYIPKGSPTTAKQYRIEERKRTVYVTSDLPPSEWDEQSLNTIFSMAQAQADHGEQQDETDDDGRPIRRTQSLVETQFIISEESPSPAASMSNVVVGQTPRLSTYQQLPRRGPTKSGVFKGIPGTPTPPDSPKRSPVQKTSPQRPKILFYHKHDPHYGFTNFSAHPVMYKGKRYPTSEHLFQSFKFQGHRPNLAEHIRTCSERPSVAFSEARRFQPEVRHDWKRVNIEKMEETLWHKFTQHEDLKAELLATGDAELIEVLYIHFLLVFSLSINHGSFISGL